ncbi:hypothetical protein K440DRAFT_636911 [Wilcoxina mikolae CBS 423.85]|nr:hypothetical protein K440DRAFT_636911 [Wilcoxina mikolae CBS 423.85]
MGDNPDEVADFCYIFGSSGQRAMPVRVVDEKAYIFGGRASFQGFPNHTAPNNKLRIIDFSKPFRSGDDVSTYIAQKPLPDNVPRGTYNAFWPLSNSTLNVFLGYHEVSRIAIERNDTAITKVYPLDAKLTYTLSSNSWENGLVKSADFEMIRIGKDKNGALQKAVSRMNAWAPGIQRGYVLGGTSYLDSPKLAWDMNREFDDHHGFLIYDLASDSWTNHTMPVKRTRMGVLAYLRTKDDEILIAFGGNTDPRIGSIKTARSMREFDIYSTRQSKWYSYRIPEDRPVPDPSIEPCHAVVSAQDNSSHQIIIYGGASGSNQLLVDSSVWVLSLPSFDWVKLAGNSTDASREPGKRMDPACALVGNKYMLSYGGRHFIGETGGNGILDCDLNGNAAFLLDISKGQWVDQFEPAQEYLVPDAVVKVVGGTGKGGATKFEPNGGFGDPNLAAIMKFDYQKSNITTELYSPSSIPVSSGANTGAIAGGTIAGIAVLAGIVLGFLVYRRQKDRRRKSEMKNSPAELDPMAWEFHEAPGVVLSHEAPGSEIMLNGGYSQSLTNKFPVGELHGDMPGR